MDRIVTIGGARIGKTDAMLRKMAALLARSIEPTPVMVPAALADDLLAHGIVVGRIGGPPAAYVRIDPLEFFTAPPKDAPHG